MSRAIIFDLDGTLADTIEDIAAAVNGALTRRGLAAHGIPALKKMVGNGFRALVVAALPPESRNDDLVEEIRIEASTFYAAHPLDRTRAYPGIPELLAELARLGVPRAVLSNKPHDLVLRVVEGLFPGAGFAVIRGEMPAFPRKPDPASALDIARILERAPADICYLGDSDVDMLTARNAGMLAAGAGWGFRGPEELGLAGADAVLTDPAELLDLI